MDYIAYVGSERLTLGVYTVNVWTIYKKTGETIVPPEGFKDGDTLVIAGDEIEKEDWYYLNLGDNIREYSLVLPDQKIIPDGIGAITLFELEGHPVKSRLNVTITCNEETPANLFGYFDKLKTVSLTSTINIGENAFNGCDKLTSISMPGVVNIGENAFEDCSALVYVDLPSSLEHIEGNPFIGCDCLETVNVDPRNPYFESVDGVLYTKGRKKLIAYPQGKTGDAFECSTLEIGRGAFRNSAHLKSVTLPQAKVIGEGAFSNLGQLTDVHLPKAELIGDYAFESSSLYAISMPHVSHIGKRAFLCKNLCVIELGASPPAIDMSEEYKRTCYGYLAVPGAVKYTKKVLKSYPFGSKPVEISHGSGLKFSARSDGVLEISVGETSFLHLDSLIVSLCERLWDPNNDNVSSMNASALFVDTLRKIFTPYSSLITVSVSMNIKDDTVQDIDCYSVETKLGFHYREKGSSLPVIFHDNHTERYISYIGDFKICEQVAANIMGKLNGVGFLSGKTVTLKGLKDTGKRTQLFEIANNFGWIITERAL